MIDTKAILPQLLDITINAGAIIMEHYQKGEWEVSLKEDDSPVTIADREAHAAITESLATLTPDIPVISEEGTIPAYDERRTWEQFWLVDPLDGTKEFIAKRDHFTVNIALIDGQHPFLGVIYAPVFDELVFATQTDGAFQRVDDMTLKQLSIRPYQAGQETFLVSHAHAKREHETLSQHCPDATFLSMGSSQKFAALAQGKADAYLRFAPTSEWDTAAGQCIVEAAGGQVCTPDLKPLTYNKESLTNPGFLAFGESDLPWKKILKPH